MDKATGIEIGTEEEIHDLFCLIYDRVKTSSTSPTENEVEIC